MEMRTLTRGLVKGIPTLLKVDFNFTLGHAKRLAEVTADKREEVLFGIIDSLLDKSTIDSVYSLTSQEIYYLLVALYVNTKGSHLPVTYSCLGPVTKDGKLTEGCGNTDIPLNVDMTKLDVKPLLKDYKPLETDCEVEGRGKTHLVFRIPNHGRVREFESYGESLCDDYLDTIVKPQEGDVLPENAYDLAMQSPEYRAYKETVDTKIDLISWLHEVDGEVLSASELYDFSDGLSIPDLEKSLEYRVKYDDWGVKQDAQIKCPKCGGECRVALPFSVAYLFPRLLP